ncbi:GH3 auxin-responsive promoter family protein [Fulvivirgaceae bacterium BMA10]|uniref:GH3 auxin-responsive promoter family protein n=1 Tax=Splendidivirga corallicola TaxID=3051826 RepID=A0ABT8L002_9BACT|nr:GH3 auxin-responsive promoter family protein [Fulvivirgaceae bacterium BMA10]
MPILGTLLKKGIRIRESLDQDYSSPFDLQKIELKKLLISAAQTDFGQEFRFKEILKQFKSYRHRDFYEKFKANVPLYNYNKIYDEWWYKTRQGKSNVCWPGRVKYFALSSGTSDASSKYIPITRDMIKAVRKTSIRQILSLSHYDLPDKVFNKGILMLGGSTHLNYNGTYFEGDLSGITASQLPFWFQHFYKPGRKISQHTNWNDKLDEITRQAREWDIGVIVGVPAWIQILMEKIIEYYKIDTIHDIWPNLMIYVHGGVSFDPYRKGFEKLFARPLTYIETYLASEGFIAFQSFPNRKSMRLVLNNDIFYEFVPFNEKNFQTDGELVDEPETLMIDQVLEGQEYAILLSTSAGAWRYLIGDVIKFTSVPDCEIVITGRTKHFLSLCGEHLSVDNMNKAIELVANELNIHIKEFSVAGIPHDSLFAHHWYIGTDDDVSETLLKEKIDEHLQILNDDYRVERSAALKEIFVDKLPSKVFYNWLKKHGKEGGQSKFPRVLKKNQLKDWQVFLEEEKAY